MKDMEKEIKKKLSEIANELDSIRWSFNITTDYLAEANDMIEKIQKNQQTKMIKDIDMFRRELQREGLYSNKLDEFIDMYMRFYN